MAARIACRFVSPRTRHDRRMRCVCAWLFYASSLRGSGRDRTLARGSGEECSASDTCTDSVWWVEICRIGPGVPVVPMAYMLMESG
eukprot:7297763-Prymnesium_polylepis.1